MTILLVKQFFTEAAGRATERNNLTVTKCPKAQGTRMRIFN